MANAFAPFSYGRDVVIPAANIQGARTRNALAQQQEQRAQTTFDQNQKQQNTEHLYRALTEISENPNAAGYHIPKLQQMGVMRSDFDYQSMSPEEIQTTAAQGAQALGKALGMGTTTSRMGKYNPSDYTPESWAKFIDAGGKDANAALLVRYERPRVTPEQASDVSGAQEQAKLEARLKTEPKIARQVGLAKAATTVANKAYESIDKIGSNIANLREASELVRGGAGTGPILSMMPSIRANSVALDTMQGRLGLDVVGAVTFGALSKGELDLAKSVALPTGLDGPELVEWIEKKISAQEKLAGYLEEQANFLSQGGTQKEWRDQLKEKKAATKAAGLPDGTVDNGDGTFTLPSGQKVRKKQ